MWNLLGRHIPVTGLIGIFCPPLVIVKTIHLLDVFMESGTLASESKSILMLMVYLS